MAKRNSATVSISEASRLTGKGRQTLYRHIKQGKLSAITDGDGSRVIQLAELERLYSLIASTGQPSPISETPNIVQANTVALIAENDRLKSEVERLFDQVKDLRRDKEWLQSLVNDLNIKKLPSPLTKIYERFFGDEKN